MDDKEKIEKEAKKLAGNLLTGGLAGAMGDAAELIGKAGGEAVDRYISKRKEREAEVERAQTPKP